MDEIFTEFVQFMDWYRCRHCGFTERHIPEVSCPVCGRLIIQNGGNDNEHQRKVYE
jgi:rubrerythrin